MAKISEILKEIIGGSKCHADVIWTGNAIAHALWKLAASLAEKYNLADKIWMFWKFRNISAVVENVNPVIKQRMHKGWIFDIQYWLLAMKADKYSNISEY